MKLKTVFTLNAVVFNLTTINFLFFTSQIIRFYSPVPEYIPGIDVIWSGVSWRPDLRSRRCFPGGCGV